jgi:hypothetical protein
VTADRGWIVHQQGAAEGGLRPDGQLLWLIHYHRLSHPTMLSGRIGPRDVIEIRMRVVIAADSDHHAETGAAA